jgi:hypothetical protein
MDFQTLVTSRYTKPGTYIGQLIRPSGADLTGDPRIPCYIGRGSRLAEAKNEAIVRGYIVGTSDNNRGELSFASVAPHVAPLPAKAVNDQSIARLYTQDGKEVSPNAWSFSESVSGQGYDQVIIIPAAFDATKTYLIDYQSAERSVVDVLPFDNIREVVHMSLQTDQDEFTEYEDFFFPATYVNVGADSSGNDIDEDAVYNTNTSSSLGAVLKTSGAADLLATTGSSFTHKYSRRYSVELLTSGTNLDTLRTLVNELGDDYTLHIAEVAGGVHGAPDAINTLSAPVQALLGDPPSGWSVANIITIVADIAAKYDAHRQLVAGGVHANPDTFNVFAGGISVTTLGEAARFANTLRILFEAGSGGTSAGHFNQTNQAAVVHSALPTQAITAPACNLNFKYSAKPSTPGWVNNSVASGNIPEPLIDETFSVTITSPNVADVNGVGSSTSQPTLETASGILVKLDFTVAQVDKLAAGDTWEIVCSGPGLIELDERYFNQNQFTNIGDVMHVDLLALANALRLAYEEHRVVAVDGSNAPVHGNGVFVDIVNVVEEPIATDEATCVALLNDIKAKYNAHEVYVTNAVHANATQNNQVAIADATSWASAISLANALRLALIAHLADTPKHTTTDTVTSTPAAAVGTGSLTVSSESDDYTGTRNRRFKIEVTAVNGVADVDFAWKSWGEVEGIDSFINSGTVSTVINGDTIALDAGILLLVDLGASNFVVGDTFTLLVLAPRIFYKGHDDRTYRLQVTDTSASPTNAITFSWYTDTPEGGFGVSEVATLYSGAESPYVELPDNVILATRNLAPTNRHSKTSHSNTGDLHQFSITLNDTIDFSLKQRVTQTIPKTSFRFDPTGVITGLPNQYYAVLSGIPLSDDGTSYGEFGVESVKNAQSGATVAAINIAGTAYLYVTKAVYDTLAAAGITTIFFTRGDEPDPGATYYLSALYLRPDEFYDTPLLLVGAGQAEVTLNPMGPDNHLAMMVDSAFEAPGLQAAYVVQVRDLDEDGMFTDEDFKRAIDAAEAKSGITDICVLSNWGSLADTLNHLNRTNDPFQKKERLGWFGAPQSILLGDSDTSNTLIFTAKKTLQVYGNHPAHGTRILAGPRYVKKTITLPSGATQEVTLDGSFLAGSLAALTDGFTDPGDVILKKQVPGWDEIEVFTEGEDLRLGASSIIYLSDLGAGVFQCEESTTVDILADDFHEISGMTQKQNVTRVVRTNMDAKLIAYVPPSVQAAISVIRGTLVDVLTGLISQGRIARYQDDSGSDRAIDPSKDILVTRDRATKTLYNFMYAYYLRYPIKRLYGLYAVDTNRLVLQA